MGDSHDFTHSAGEGDDFLLSSQESNCSAHFMHDESLLDQNEIDTKVFNDPIHGHIEIHPLLVKVIDTPQFQRLRNIKQLGANYFVYPGASHNRFEHCIGTCYLAGKMVRHLRSKQSNLEITDEDVLCVELAALVHDLGHGPFSHLFDLQFLPRMRPGEKLMHEEASCKMFDHLIRSNELWGDFERYHLTETDVTFVKEMIAGPLPENKGKVGWKFDGRQEDKSFLYEIVSNDRNKVDVDKWDYFARDCHHLGVRNSFDHNRFLRFCRVLRVEGERRQICARDKECFALYQMFHVRNTLHRVAYQHKCKTAIEAMVCDAMCLADKKIKFRGSGGRDYSISGAIDDPEAFTRLTDNVFYQILNSLDKSEEMTKARTLIENILKRKLYSFVGQTRSRTGNVFRSTYQSCVEYQREIASQDQEGVLDTDDLLVVVKNYSYGMKDRNPCDHFRFFSKDKPNKPYLIRRQDLSGMLPGSFQDSELQVYCKLPEKTELARMCFRRWCEEKEMVLPKDHNPSLTPMKRPGQSVERPAKRRCLPL